MYNRLWCFSPVAVDPGQELQHEGHSVLVLTSLVTEGHSVLVLTSLVTEGHSVLVLTSLVTDAIYTLILMRHEPEAKGSRWTHYPKFMWEYEHWRCMKRHVMGLWACSWAIIVSNCIEVYSSSRDAEILVHELFKHKDTASSSAWFSNPVSCSRRRHIRTQTQTHISWKTINTTNVYNS